MTVAQVKQEMTMSEITKTATQNGFKPSKRAWNEGSQTTPFTPSLREQEAYNFLLLLCDEEE